MICSRESNSAGQPDGKRIDVVVSADREEPCYPFAGELPEVGGYLNLISVPFRVGSPPTG